MERRLAAILAADMVGFARLMELDEEGTLARQKAHRRELIDPEIADHHGHIVKTTGDGLLVEFASVVDAVKCAVAIQTAMADREAEVPEPSRIRYRIGINLGDVIFDDSDIFGDGVNIAARLEALAEPGGICFSDVVHQSVADKLDLPCRDLGRQRVKNISRPIHVWRWETAEQPPVAVAGAIALEQEIRFCTASDGVQIAYATVGQGPPLVKAPNWMNHLEYDWTTRKFIDDGFQKAPVHVVEPFPIDIEHAECIVRYLPGNHPIGLHLSVVTHTTQQAIGNSGRAPGTSRHFFGPFNFNLQIELGRGTIDDLAQFFDRVELQTLHDAESVPQRRRQQHGPGGCTHQGEPR